MGVADYILGFISGILLSYLVLLFKDNLRKIKENKCTMETDIIYLKERISNILYEIGNLKINTSNDIKHLKNTVCALKSDVQFLEERR